mgnify:FL=1
MFIFGYIAMGFCFKCPDFAKLGDDLLFQRLSGSTIGATWFHGRVRDGIGWFTGAMATKLSKIRVTRYCFYL